MKKVVSLAVAGATLAGAAFADVNFGVWGRSNWVVAANQENGAEDGDDIVTFNTQSWTGYAPRVGLSVSGDAGNVGFAFDIHNNGTVMEQGGNCYAWAKPIDQVKISLGKHDVGALRGDACFGLWNTLRFGVTKGPKGESEGWTFMKTDKNGAIITVTPIENLTLLASIGFPLTNADGENSWALGTEKGGVKLADALGTDSIYAVAYTLPETATFKLGVKENGKTTKEDGSTAYWNTINASVEVNAIENAYFAVGAFIPTVAKKDGGAEKIINLYGNYKVNDQLKAHLKAGIALDCEDSAENKKDGQMGFSVSAGADYDIGDGLSAYAHVEYANGIYMKNTSADDTDCFDFGLGIFKALANGKIGVSFIGATNNYGFTKVYDNGFSWAVPVTLEYSF